MIQEMEKQTPLMQQYFEIKADHPDALLLFQVGDFYEMFFQDAKTASAHLAIALTKRGKNKGEDIPLCGVPVHALNHYLTKLLKGGFKVALCQQLSEPQPGTVVQRGVTQVFTPGTLTDTAMLDEKSASYLLAFFPHEKWYGMVFGELLTAQLFATVVPVQNVRSVESELIRFSPDEIVTPPSKDALALHSYFKKAGYFTSVVRSLGTEVPMGDGNHPFAQSAQWAQQQFAPKAYEELMRTPAIAYGLGTLYWYLKQTQEKALEQFKSIHFYQPDEYLVLDSATQSNLEIIKNSRDGGRMYTLLDVVDCSQTAMGSRMIKKWLQRPLVQKDHIIARHEVVQILVDDLSLQTKLAQNLKNSADVERIIGRIALDRAILPDFLALKDSLILVPAIKSLIEQKLVTSLGQMLSQRMADFSSLATLLECSINDQGSAKNPIKKGYDHQLDQLLWILEHSHEQLAALEAKEVENTGIASLKINYNQISGYYFEVTNPNLDKVPDYFIHVQTLVNRRRFTTQDLKNLEQAMTQAQQNVHIVQMAVFDRIKREIVSYIPALRHLATSLSVLDALVGFAIVAYNNRYCRPIFNDTQTIDISAGRHPVVEQVLGSAFIPNDALLSAQQSTWILTGPNMGGKSTFLRQVALISIMAQAGSFVPATAAGLALVDRIFTRIGAGDNLAEGKSTFLVEMEEAATICNQATAKSLVILDEVGRGTSTYDGIALAQAILEFIHTTVKARCLFATHYHELTALVDLFSGIARYHASCRMVEEQLVFTHKIISGVAPGSFGLEVARRACLPDVVLKRARTILTQLGQKKEQTGQGHIFALTQAIENNEDVDAFKHKAEQFDDLKKELKSIDCDAISPRQALDILHGLVQRLKH